MRGDDDMRRVQPTVWPALGVQRVDRLDERGDEGEEFVTGEAVA